MHLKLLFPIFFSLIVALHSYGQKVHTILRGNHSDSSFYHIARIGENEFWAGGEYGILKSVDTLGNVKSINFPNLGLDILKIERINDYVYLITDNATIYRYDILQNKFTSKQFPKFKGKCFYDVIGLPDGQILVCGGTSGIARGDKRIPRGFIAKLDQDLNEIEVVWKSYRKFAWSIVDSGADGILVASFNGLKSRILKTQDLKHWRKATKINGLIHEIAMLDGEIWYSGTKNIHYKKNGIWGQKGNGKTPNIINQTGCLWSMQRVNGSILMTTYTGEILMLNPDNSETELLAVANGFSLYDMEKISDTKVLVVGHGKGLYLVNFDL
jgi:hypothetical protein